ncbi:MAG: tetratricopeptide repeat protein [Nitrospiraceae bacterium]
MSNWTSLSLRWFTGAAFILGVLPLLTLQAEIHTVNVTGTHTLGTFDSESDGQRLALLQAKTRAAAQALPLLEGDPEIKALRLGREELLAYSSSVLRFDEYPGHTSTTTTQTTMRTVEVKLTVDTARLAGHLRTLFQHERARSQLTRAMEKIVEYRKEIAADTEKLSPMTFREQVQPILEHRRERLKLIDVEERLAATWSVLAGLREPSASADPTLHRSGVRGNAEEHRKKAASLTEEGKYDDAIAEFRVALQLMPTMVGAHIGLGAALQGKGDLDGAVSQYRLLLTQHPNDASVHMNLGTVLQKQGNLDGAIAEYRIALQHRPDYALGHFNLGTALATKSLTDEAITEYRTAIRLKPDLVHAYFDLGSLLKDKDQPKEAADAFREYVRRAPHTPANQPWIEKAQAFLADRYEKSRLERRELR